MQLKSEAAVRVAATPRRRLQPPNQMVCLVYRATRASRPLSATGRRSYAPRQLHRYGRGEDMAH
jgi:hypothetical protein